MVVDGGVFVCLLLLFLFLWYQRPCLQDWNAGVVSSVKVNLTKVLHHQILYCYSCGCVVEQGGDQDGAGPGRLGIRVLCLFACLFVCFFVFLFVCLFVGLFVCLFVCLVCFCLLICLVCFVDLFACLHSVCLS